MRSQRLVSTVFTALFLVLTPDVLAQVIIETRPGQVPPALPPPIQIPGMPPRDRRGPETGTAQLRGRVTAADTIAPLRKVQVRLMAAELRTTRMATTDAEGRYEFRDLPAGRYTVLATKPGYVSLQYGQRRPFEQGRPIELADKQAADKIDFTLPRGGVLTGRIVDEFNEPVSDASVTAMQLRYIGGRRRPVPAGRPSQTNDLGQFRVWGLPPGEYLVSATLRTFGGMDPQMVVGATQDPTGYAPTYYPGTASVAEAQRVSVTVGAEASGVEFALHPVRTAKITGMVVDADGRPFTAGQVTLVQTMGSGGGEGMMFMTSTGGGRLASDGSFTLSNVAPGEYMLQARVRRAKPGDSPGSGSEFVPPGEGENAVANITVSGEDISGLVLVATRGAKMSGYVTFEGASPAASRTENLRISAQPAGGEVMPMMGGGMPGRIDTDGKFELTGLVGRRHIRAMGAPGWYLKSVRVDSRDFTDSGIDFKGTDEITGVEIVLTARMAQISGTVKGPDGKPAKDYAVIVFPEDKDRWTADSRYFGQARPDQEGRFKVVGLPDETYLVAALDYVDANEWRDPEFLERLRESATRVTAAGGDLKELELKIVSVP
ncbi:MAG: MSCRAMM family protein [Vicinamibacterales bacterium]